MFCFCSRTIAIPYFYIMAIYAAKYERISGDFKQRRCPNLVRKWDEISQPINLGGWWWWWWCNGRRETKKDRAKKRQSQKKTEPNIAWCVYWMRYADQWPAFDNGDVVWKAVSSTDRTNRTLISCFCSIRQQLRQQRSKNYLRWMGKLHRVIIPFHPSLYHRIIRVNIWIRPMWSNLWWIFVKLD